MLINYFKTAYRNLSRNKVYALINISGLAIGISACILIFLVIRFETSFDNFHPKKNNLYRIATLSYVDGKEDYNTGTSFPVAPALRAEFPKIEQVARIYRTTGEPVTIDNPGGQKQKFKADLFYIEPDFFSMFNFEWLIGNAKDALGKPNSAALTQKTAEKYFGDWHNAIGKIFSYGNKKDQPYTINGILKDVPANTDFPLEIVLSFSSLRNTSAQNNMEDWVSTFGPMYTFVELPDDVSIPTFNKDLIAFAKKHKPAEYAKDIYIAQPLSMIHYDERLGNYNRHTFSKSLILALELIGLFLLLIACVNFINLATAQAVNRSKEVGVRKVLGSSRRQLAFQFLSETAIITTVSLVAAIIIAYCALPFLNQLLHVQIVFNLAQPVLILFLLSVFVLVTFLSGLYPAIILSGFSPITALKTKITSKMTGGISMRRVLVVLQFGIAHVLIIGTLIVVGQMNLFKNTSLGFDKAAIINIPVPGDSVSHSKIDFFKSRLLQNPSIRNASFSFSSPSAERSWTSDFKFDHSTKNTPFNSNLKWADIDYFKTYGLQFVAGRPYRESDTVKEIVVNETLLHKIGINDPKEAIGKEINFWDGAMIAPIVGVIRDFNSYSLRDPMAPVVLSTFKNTYQTLSIKVAPGKEKEVIAYAEKIWNQTYPDYVYEYSFLDESIANFYKQESQLSQLYKIFAFIAIFISCLGLYGLVSFMAAQRTKEVGIRKVLGATPAHIVYLLSKEFSLLIMIAFVIATPVAWYIMHGWLQNYTYRIRLSAWIFLLAIGGSMLIAWVTVAHRAIKAAMANPVKNLRTE